MPIMKNEARPPEYDALSMQHCYINTPPDRPVEEGTAVFWWLPHLATEAGEYTAPSADPAFSYSLPFDKLAERTVTPEGLPPLTAAQILTYIRQLGAETLVEYQTKTGAFEPPPPPPEASTLPTGPEPPPEAKPARKVPA